jgi:Domain of unknown function (DUF5666)
MNASPFSLAVLALAVASASCEGFDSHSHHHHDESGEGDTTTVAPAAGPATAADLAVGQRVRVRFDDSVYPYAAATVEIAGDSADAAGTLEGAVSAVDAKGGTITLLGLSVAVGTDTLLSGVDSLDKLSPGQHVQVFVAPGSDGKLAAARVAVRPAEVIGVVEGRVDKPNEVRIGVMGRTFSVSGDTAVVRVGGSPATCAQADSN